MTPDCTDACDVVYYELRIRTDTHPEASALAWGWGSWRDALMFAVDNMLGKPLAIAAILTDMAMIPFDGDGQSDDDDVLTHGEVVRTRPSCPHFGSEVHSFTYKFRRPA